MLDQIKFGEKLKHHREALCYTQAQVGEMIGVSAQAVSKWESGECLPDCFNLKSIGEIYKVSLDVLLDTESDSDLESVVRRIEQIGTEYVWSSAVNGRYDGNIRRELGDDLWQMWKGLYFAEVGDRKIQAKSKVDGNLRIIGSYGLKIWDDDGAACIVKSSLINNISDSIPEVAREVVNAILSAEGIKLIIALSPDLPTEKAEIIEKTGIELSRLNELLLLLTENKVIEFERDARSFKTGYILSGHCGIVAYMLLAAVYILGKPNYTVSQYLSAK